MTPKQSADTSRSDQLKEVRTRAHSSADLDVRQQQGGVPNNNNHYNKKKSNGSAAFFFLLPLLMMTADGEKKTAEFDSFVARGERATAATTDHKSADFFFRLAVFSFDGSIRNLKMDFFP